ncbi:MAG: hypothetical protein AAB538_01490, partial [Patescibacteria group bacterium]
IATWWIPFVLLMAVILTYTATHPRRWLVVLAILGELLTALPLGIVSCVIFTPLLMQRLLPSEKSFPSFSLLGILFLTITVQYLILGSFDLGSAIVREGVGTAERYIPYLPLATGIVSATLAAFVLFSSRALARANRMP